MIYTLFLLIGIYFYYVFPNEFGHYRHPLFMFGYKYKLGVDKWIVHNDKKIDPDNFEPYTDE